MQNGARQIECNINGVGERAGNAALEEIVIAMLIRKDYFKDFYHDINTREIYKTSRLVSSLMGIPIPVNKAIIGKNAFTHSSGIHQDGILKNMETYEIINAELIGGKAGQIKLTARSGRHAVRHVLERLGFVLDDNDFAEFYTRWSWQIRKRKFIRRILKPHGRPFSLYRTDLYWNICRPPVAQKHSGRCG